MTARGIIEGGRILGASLANPESGSRLVRLLRESIEREGRDSVDIVYDGGHPRAFPNAVVPVSMAIYHYLKQGVSVRSTEPTRMHAAVLRPRRFTAADDRSDNSLMTTVWVFDEENAGHLLASLMEELSLRAACRPGVIRALEWSIYEVMDNTLTHSKRRCGMMMMQVHNHGRYVAAAVADDGIGIPRALSPTVTEDLTNFDLLELATQEGVTGVAQARRGNGLWGLRNIVAGNHGRLTLSSDDTSLHLDGQQAPRRLPGTTIEEGWPGTFIDWQLNVREPVGLPEALGGHDPVNLRLEELTDHDDTVHARVTDLVANVGTRGSGERLRNFVLNYLSEGAAAVVLDFEDVGMISSSFADEIAGGLVRELGLEVFEDRVRFRHLPEDAAALMQRGIAVGQGSRAE